VAAGDERCADGPRANDRAEAGGVGTLSGFGTSTIMVRVMPMFFPLPPKLLWG